MELPFTVLLILVAEFVISTLNADTSPQQSTNSTDTHKDKDKVEGAYIFPEKHYDDCAFEASRKLLLSQKKHFDGIKKIFGDMRKDHNATLSRTGNDEHTADINATMYWLETIIGMDLELVEQFFFGDKQPADDDDKKIPWRDASSSIVLHHWKSIKKWANEIRGDANLRKQLTDMQEVIKVAIYEIERYKEYVQKVYPVFTDAPEINYNYTIINITQSPAT